MDRLNRDGVKKLLNNLAWDELVRLALIDRRITRTLLSLLYDADDYLHWLAIDAIGRIGGAMADTDPEKTRELIRRLLWNLNDESGGTPWGAAGAIGAIVANRPDLFASYLSLIFPYYDDDSVCPEFIWSVAAVGQHCPEAVVEYNPFLVTALGHSRPEVRGYAAWAVGVIGIVAACADLEIAARDGTPAAVYETGGVYQQATVGALAAASLRRLAAVN